MILVVGATGHLGGLIAQSLLHRGKPVRILVRPGSSDDRLTGAEAVIGDLKDPATLRDACAGVDQVVTTANSVARGGEDTVESVDRVGNANLVDAAAAAGVRHFVFASALGASADHPAPFLRAKGETEQRLRGSGMAWTILQPNAFMDIWVAAVVGGPALAGQPVSLVGEGRRRHSLVAMRDVAAYAIAGLDDRQAHGQTLYIGGPQPITWRDAIAAFERALGHPVPVRIVPPGHPIPGVPDVMNPVLAAFETYDSPLDMNELAATYKVSATSLHDFVQDFVAGAGRPAFD